MPNSSEDQPHAPPKRNQSSESLLSNDEEKRAIELAFLNRLLAFAEASSAQILKSANVGGHQESDDDLWRIQSPVFAELARVLEESLPKDSVRFQFFRGRR